MSLPLVFLESFAGVASALPVALPLLLQQLPADAEELHDLASPDLEAFAEELLEGVFCTALSVDAEAFAAQQLPPDDLEAEQDAFSVAGFCSFVLDVCALAATPMKATKANKANNFFMSLM